jgi:hypothetical protein
LLLKQQHIDQKTDDGGLTSADKCLKKFTGFKDVANDELDKASLM